MNFFPLAIFLLAHVASFSGQINLWRSYFFTFPQSNYFDKAVNFLEQLFLQSNSFFEDLFFQNSHLFAVVIFSEKLLFQSIVSTEQPLLENRKVFRAVLIGGVSFLMEDLLRIKISTEKLLFWSRYFCTASTFSEEQHFGKS